MAKNHSKMLTRFDLTSPDNARFASDLNNLLSVSPETRVRCIEALPLILFARTSSESDQVKTNLLDASPEQSAALAGALNCLAFFATRLAMDEYRGDTAEALAADLREAGLINDENAPTFIDTIQTLQKDVVSAVETETTHRVTATGFAPAMAGVGTTVELRAIQKKTYDPMEPIETYEPTISGLVGIVSIYIRTDDPEQSRFFFQADRTGLELLISGLQAAARDLDVLTQSVQLSDK